MILHESTLDGAGVIIRNDIPIKNGETVTRGEALIKSNSGLTKCAATGMPDAIYLGKEEDTNGRVDRYIEVRQDDRFVIDIVGDTSAVNVGTTTYALTADGLNLDAATATGGHIIVNSVDIVKKKARIQFK